MNASPLSRRARSARTCAILVSAAASTLFSVRSATAAPYAGEVSLTGGTLSYNLSEDADNVTIIVDGVPQNLGAQTKGPHTLNGVGTPGNYKIVASKNAAAGYLTRTAAVTGTVQKVSDDGVLMSYNSPRGLAVNNSPTSPYFGRIYISNSAAGSVTGGITPARTLGEGIYILKTDRTDALGMGSTALNGGTPWDVSANSPYRLTLDKAGNVYIGDFADAGGQLTVADPNITSRANLLVGSPPFGSGIIPDSTRNHGNSAGLAVTGTLGTDLTLYTIDEDLSATGSTSAGMNSLWTYNIGATTSAYNGVPTRAPANPLLDFVNGGGVIVDLARGNDGKFYESQSRSVGSELGVAVVSSDGNKILYDSLADTIARGLDGDTATAGTQDIFRTTMALAVSPDQKYMAVLSNNNTAIVVPLIDGIPDVPNRINVASMGTLTTASARDIAFDTADNLYVISSGTGALRVLAAGGLSQTVFDSAGNATLVNDPTYTTTGSGNLSTAGSWLLGVVPNGKDQRARIVGSVASTVTVDTPTTLGFLYFDNPAGTTLDGASTLTMDTFGEPRIQSLNGNVTISAPVTLNGNTQFTVSGATNTMTVNNMKLAASTTTAGISKAGAGTLILNSGSANIGTSFLNGGVVRIADGNFFANSPTFINVNNGLEFASGVTSASLGALGGSGNLVLNNVGGGAVNLTAGARNTATTYSGAMSGSGSFTKAGTGRMIMTGTNTYSGTTTVTGGILRAEENVGLVPQNLVLNGGQLESANTMNRPLGTGNNQMQLPGGASGFSAAAGNVAVNIGGGGAQLTWGDPLFNPTSLVLSTSATNNILDFQNPINLNGQNRTISETANTSQISGALTNGSITKTGAGSLILTTTNTINAATLSAGELGIFSEDEIGGSTTPLTFNGGVLQLRTADIHNIDTHPINNTSFSGGFNIFDPSNTFTVNQALSGSGSVRKLGAGTLILAASNSYTGGTTLSGGYINLSSDAQLGATSGSITINGTATLLTSASINTTRQINLGASGGTFDTNGFSSTFAAVVTGTGTFAKNGGETLTTNGYRPNNLQLNSGTLVVSAGRNATAKLSNVTSIGYNGGNLDLGENDLIVNYSAAAQATANINAAFNGIHQGYNGGNWQGGGITSNAAAAQSSTAHPTALGYAEASTTGQTTFDGVATDATMILVRYTYSGDANLDGRVNMLDFNALSINYGTGLVWAKGDFNYDNSVDTNDFNLLAQNFNLSLLPADGLGALVPEPIATTLMAMGVGMLLSRRRR